MLFCVAIVICGVLEYFTSYIMEKIFHARWWDYTENKYNINGRVCLETIIPFGILGLILIYIVNPFIFGMLNSLDVNLLNIITIIVASIFFIDFIISFRVIFNVRSVTSKFDEENPKDNTEEISQKVREFLRGKSILNRRLVNAFPKLTAILKEQSEKIKKQTVKVKKDITKKATEVKEDITNKANEMKEDITNKANEVMEDWNEKTKEIKKVIKNKKNKS